MISKAKFCGFGRNMGSLNHLAIQSLDADTDIAQELPQQPASASGWCLGGQCIVHGCLENLFSEWLSFQYISTPLQSMFSHEALSMV